MKKIPTLYVRVFDETTHRIIGIKPEFTKQEFEEILKDPETVATIKWDGSACAIIDGKFYKRYDCKKGRKPKPEGIPCEESRDPITGHWPHWYPISAKYPGDKWFFKAMTEFVTEDGYPEGTLTLEAIGKHFNGNPYGYDDDICVIHGSPALKETPRDFMSIKRTLEEMPIEGLVYWCYGEPVFKIKRSDFGLKWPVPEAYEVSSDTNKEE